MLSRIFTPTDAGSARAIVAGFVLVVLSFSASTLLSLRALQVVGSEADAIGSNVLPSVSTISDARTALRNLEAGLRDVTDEIAADVPSPATTAPSAALRTLEADVEDYFGQPIFPGEDASWPSIRREVAALRSAAGRVLSAAEARDRAAARRAFRTEVTPVAERIDDLFKEVLVFHADQAQRAAERIARAHHGARVLSLALAGGSAALAILLLALVLRAHAGFAELTARHAALLDARAAELELFAGRVAHDIKAPLGLVALSLDVALRHGDDARAGEALARGKRGVARAIEVVDGLYAFAGSSAAPDLSARSNPRDVVLGLLEDVRPAADAASVELRCELAEVSDVRCPAGVLGSVAGNLVRNAIKHMGATQVRKVTVRTVDDGAVRLEVEDTGPGIPLAAQPSLFQPYVRAASSSTPGLGLGLATVKRLVEGYGGAVGFTSSPGAGSTFWISLPRAGGG